MDILAEIGKQGFIGLLLAGSLGVNAFLFKRYIEQLDARRTDAIQYRDQLKEPMQELQRTLSAIVLILQNAGKK